MRPRLRLRVAPNRVSAGRYQRAPQPQGPWPARPAQAPARRRRTGAGLPQLRRGAGSGIGEGRAAGRAWAAVADRGEIVSPLQWRRLPLGEPACVRGDAPGEPVDEPPPGASGSSRISASERVPVGGADHDSGGERSSPSQVWRRGMVPPGAKAPLVSENSAIANLPWNHVAFPSLDSLRRSPQQVTWSRPITAPWAWFQTGITSGVGSSSTWQRLAAK